MDYRIINLNDKWKESLYHYKRMKTFANEFIKRDQETLAESQKNFRYEFNSFVNSSRSVTFVLQKTFRNKFNGFEEWYKQQQEILKLNDFAKSLIEIRNSNQKEGNYYPHICAISAINTKYALRINYSAAPISDNEIAKHIAQSSIISNPSYEPKEIIYDNSKDESLERTLVNMNDFALNILYSDILEAIESNNNEKTEFIEFNITLDKNTYYKINEFLENCSNYLSQLREICINSEKEFLK